MDNTPVLIIGGGTAGLAAAAEVARRGLACLLVERGPALGGRAAGFCCKALEACARCGACRLGDLLDAVGSQPGVRALLRAEAGAARPLAGGGWEIDLLPTAPEERPAGHEGRDLPASQAAPLAAPLTVRARAVILAPGYAPFDPRLKTRFGYGRVPQVVSSLELERTLALGGPDPWPGRVAFIQCVGSRDHELGRPYCSRVCCAYALRLARLLRKREPHTQTTFFHMDTQGYGRAWEEELPAMRREVRFIRAMPGEVTRAEGGAEVVWAVPEGLPVREEFDLVVLSVGLGPSAEAEALGGLFGAARTADGFLGLEDQAVAAGAPGVFLAGAARGPMSISEAIAHAALAAAGAAAWAGEVRNV